MPAPDNESLESLSAALAQMVRRQRELEERVRALESQHVKQQDVAEQPPASPPPLPALDPLPPPVEYTEPPPPPEPVPLETTLGLNWINRIAVFTLLLGAAFLFKYGVDNDWFGPGTRIALGIGAAMVSLFAGHRLWKRGQTVFAQGIIGLGLALLYLSTYAAAVLYQLIPQSAAFIVMAGITVGAAGLALLYNSQAVAVLALLGGYLTPPALSTGEDHPWTLFGYVFLLNLGALMLARKQRWRALEPIAAAATILLYLGWFNQWFSESNRLVATVFAFGFYAQFSASASSELWAVFQLAASVALALIWQDQTRFAWWNLAIAAGGLGNAYRRTWAIAPIWTLACFWIPFWVWYRLDAPFAAISLAFLMFFGWALWRVPRGTLGLGLIATNAAVYYAASYILLNPQHHQYMGLLAAAVGGMHLLLARHFETRSESQNLTLGVALAFVTLAVPIQFAGFRITIAWALEGAVLAWLAARSKNHRSKNQWMRAGCWAVFALAVARLVLLDTFTYSASSQYSTLLNTRFLTFAVSTAALWLAAKFLAPSVDAAIAYVAGHVVFLFGLSLEIGGWVNRNILPENQSGVQIIAISVMLTVWAVILVMIGIKTQAAIHRILGLALVVSVVTKLYLVDVWVLGRLFRITAFLALGVLLLALSYLYSRLRPVIDRLLKSDSTRVN